MICNKQQKACNQICHAVSKNIRQRKIEKKIEHEVSIHKSSSFPDIFQLEFGVRQGEVLRPLPFSQFLSLEAVDKDNI